jgi:excisionase family DNA binding protein
MTANKHANTSLVDPQVLAELMGVSRNTILNWAKNGNIPCVKICKVYRFSIKMVEEKLGHPLRGF